MLPVLLDLGFFKIYTQGIFLVLAFLWGSFMVWKNVALTSYKDEDVFDGLFISLLGGIFVGRLFYVILNLDQFGLDILKFLLINGYPGMYGIGVIAGFLFCLYLFTLSRKISFHKLIDYIVAPLLLALAIAKIGSFFSGSEIGSQTSFFLALHYPNLDGARHLTPLYEGLLLLLGSYFAHRIVMEIRKEKFDTGFNFMFFLWYVSLVTLAFDQLKSFRTEVLGTSFDMIASSLILLTVSIFFIYYFRSLIFTRLSNVFSFGKSKEKTNH